MKKIVLLFVLALTVNINAQESVLLRLNYNKGDVYVMNMKVTQDMGALMSSTVNMEMSQEIKSVTNDLYTADMKIAKMKMDMLQNGQVISYDSTVKDEDLDEMGTVMKQQMGPFLEAMISIKGNNLGEVLESKIEPNLPGLGEMTNQSSNVIYPKEAVKVGSEWTMDKNEKGMDFNFVYKVKSISKKTVEIDISGNVGGMATGTITGNMSIDKKTGVPFTSTIDMKMNLNGQELLTSLNSEMTKK